MRVELEIERLVVHGLAVTPADRVVLQSAVEAELGRLVSERPPTATRAVPSVDGGTVGAGPSTPPARLGRDVARAVHGGLSR